MFLHANPLAQYRGLRKISRLDNWFPDPSLDHSSSFHKVLQCVEYNSPTEQIITLYMLLGYLVFDKDRGRIASFSNGKKSFVRIN